MTSTIGQFTINDRDVLIDAKVYMTTHIRIDKAPTETIEELKQFLRDKYGPQVLTGTTEEVTRFWSGICNEIMIDLAESLRKHCMKLPEFRASSLNEVIKLEKAFGTHRPYSATEKVV